MRSVQISALILGLFTGAARLQAACNVIPTTQRSFQSTQGSVSTPFAQPGDIVTVRRDTPAFAEAPASNNITLRFQPAGGPESIVGATALQPGGAGCPVDECSDGRCRCVSFTFPDTDMMVGSPGDGHGLTGPVQITVAVDGLNVATIDDLFVPGTTTHDDVLPSFTALPRANLFTTFEPGSGTLLLAAPDGAGNLFVPFDYTGLVSETSRQGRLVELAVTTATSLGTSDITAFTPEGSRLPPLIRSFTDTPNRVLGTVDFPQSVIRVGPSSVSAQLKQEDGIGPVIIPGVVVSADPLKRADSLTLSANRRFAVYETRECDTLQSPPSDCVDLNNDGDTRDYFLQALDLTTPGATPVTIDEIDGSTFPPYPDPTRFPTTLYSFVANDELVAFQIAEYGLFNLDGSPPPSLDPYIPPVFGIVRSGAYDLKRSARIPLADMSRRLEIGGGVLAFTVALDPAAGKYAYYYYDADAVTPAALPIADSAHDHFFVNRNLDLYLEVRTISEISALSPTNIFNLAVQSPPSGRSESHGKIAFVVDEALHDEDFTGNNSKTDAALFVFDAASGSVTNLHQPTYIGGVRASSRWLEISALRPAGNRAVGLYEFSHIDQPPTWVCDDPPTDGIPLGTLSDTLIPCGLFERMSLPGSTGLGFGAPVKKRNADPDFNDLVLQVYLPDSPSGPHEQPLGIAINTYITLAGTRLPFFNVPAVSGETILFAVDEGEEGVGDLNGNGVIDSAQSTGLPGQPGVLFAFNGSSTQLSVDPQTQSVAHNLGLLVALPVPNGVSLNGRFFPSPVSFIDGGASAISPALSRTLLRDVDGDGAFEESVVRNGSRDPQVLDDNCPVIANPDQADIDGDGIGDVCDICSGARCLSCQRAVAAEATKFSVAYLKAVTQCELAQLLRGTTGACPDDNGGSGEPGLVAANAIAKAREAFERKTATVCGGRDRTCNADSIDEALPVSLGWPEMCPGSLQIESPSCSMAVNDCGDVVSCLECVDASAYQGAVSFVFKSMIPVDAKASPHIGKCQRAVGKATRAYVVKRSQTLAKCWTEQIGGIHGGLCPDPGAPEGSDPRKAADAIAKIEAKLRSVICAACADPMQRCDDVDPGLIGFPSLCPDVTSSGGSSCSHSISTLRDAIDCIRCIGDFTVNCTDAAQVPQLKAYPKNCSAQLP